MEFTEFKKEFSEHAKQLLANATALFVMDTDKDKLWETYLESFPPEQNNVFRERRVHDCSCCRRFIKVFGNTVAITSDYSLVSIWDFKTTNPGYQQVIDALSNYVKSCKVRNVFVTKEETFGVNKNYDEAMDGTVLEWEHFHVKLPNKFVTYREQKGELIDQHRANKQVFERSITEISKDSIVTTLDLIAQNSLYKGEEWRDVLGVFLSLQNEYYSLPDDKKDAFLWSESHRAGGAISKIKNHSIGVLLMDVSSGTELDEAVRKYEAIVAPTNYKRPKTIFTAKMVEEAQRTIESLGLMDSLKRRFAVLEDISVNNILFANRNAARRMIGGNVFDELKSSSSAVNPKRFDRCSEISIDQFITEVIPGVTGIDAFFESRHIPGLVSLIAPAVSGSKNLFKWENNFSWAYSGNITDSTMKERVKNAGGNVNGILRFSIQWNENGDNENDFDAHCMEPNGNNIFFPNKRIIHPSSGSLDVDIIHPSGVAVENIVYTDFNAMINGEYIFAVHCFSHRGGRSGFRAEIEFEGQVLAFDYSKDVPLHQIVVVAKIRKTKTGFEVVQSLDSKVSSRDEWELKTNQFHPVSILMYSPNYWDQQSGIGHRHYFFMLNGCVNKTRPNGFFNEFLPEEFMKHKRVFEALGSKMMVPDSENQLSGIGFSATKRNSLICKLSGNFDRTIKITF